MGWAMGRDQALAKVTAQALARVEAGTWVEAMPGMVVEAPVEAQ